MPGYILLSMLIVSFLICLVVMNQLSNAPLIKNLTNHFYYYFIAQQIAEEKLAYVYSQLPKLMDGSQFLGEDLCGRKIYLLQVDGFFHGIKSHLQRRFVDESTKKSNQCLSHMR